MALLTLTAYSTLDEMKYAIDSSLCYAGSSIKAAEPTGARWRQALKNGTGDSPYVRKGRICWWGYDFFGENFDQKIGFTSH